MKKRGSINIVVVVSAIIIIIFTGVIAWQAIKIINEEKTDTGTNDISGQENLGAPANETIGETTNLPNETGINKTSSTNETPMNKTGTIDAGTIPNPKGSITPISRDDSSGEYFCNNTENPTHGIRLYTYRIINGIKNLSQEYIESKKINVCDDYNNETVMAGVTYNIEWKWDAVEGADGYKAYLYYVYKNVSINYNDSIEVKTNRIMDTSLDLWR